MSTEIWAWLSPSPDSRLGGQLRRSQTGVRHEPQVLAYHTDAGLRAIGPWPFSVGSVRAIEKVGPALFISCLLAGTLLVVFGCRVRWPRCD